MSAHFEFFDTLRLGRIGEMQIVSRSKVLDILPPHWRDERVSGPEEWFVRTGRGLGLDIQYILERNLFVVVCDPMLLCR